MLRKPALWVANRFGRRYRIDHSLNRFERASSERQPDIPDVDNAIADLRSDLANRICFVGRWGTTEYDCLFGHLGLRKWYEPRMNDSDHTCMSVSSGFFPAGNDHLLTEFARTYLDASKDCTHHRLLGNSLCPGEAYVVKSINATVKLLPSDTLNIARTVNKWIDIIHGRKVLFVSPFVKDMESQFSNLRNIWGDNLFFPDFEPVWHEAIQSRGNSQATKVFNNWFEALGYMKGQIDKLTFDIAFLSCGAYGMPLAAHIFKSQKRSVIYFGGELQLLFGLTGPRWEKNQAVQALRNQYWQTPQHNLGDQSLLSEASRYACRDTNRAIQQ